MSELKYFQSPNKRLEIVLDCLLVLSITILTLTNFIINTFHVSFEGILFTILSPLTGADDSFVVAGLKYCLPRILCYSLVAFVLVRLSLILLCGQDAFMYISNRRKTKEYCISVNKLSQFIIAAACLITIPFAVNHFYQGLDIGTYIERSSTPSTLYDDHYVDPASVQITQKDSTAKPKNLIYIYLESMETRFQIDGKSELCNCIPSLTRLASFNTSFGGDENTPGGLKTMNLNSDYTVASIFASSTGSHYSFPIEQNTMDQHQTFAPKITAIGDILEGFGYQQEFLCGSDAAYAGRNLFFKTHGNYTIFDVNTALELGYTKDKVWWGFDDSCLFRIAKDELTHLSQEDKPFNLTMLTVDTHPFGGYTCDLCREDFSDPLANVFACTDRQVNDFVAWVKAQPFAEDTVIVITGDHLRMDNDLVPNIDDRRIYNCIINSEATPIRDQNSRLGCQMDMFPTILSALGFSIEGNRLGLGTDLFSDSDTLIEQFGEEWLFTELSKYSPYYAEHFY